jgi:hypothetical protein
VSAGDPNDHRTIIATKQEPLWTAEGSLLIITEYRADGCVTWRKA